MTAPKGDLDSADACSAEEYSVWKKTRQEIKQLTRDGDNRVTTNSVICQSCDRKINKHRQYTRKLNNFFHLERKVNVHNNLINIHSYIHIYFEIINHFIVLCNLI